MDAIQLAKILAPLTPDLKRELKMQILARQLELDRFYSFMWRYEPDFYIAEFWINEYHF
jgi:hypothetical protein